MEKKSGFLRSGHTEVLKAGMTTALAGSLLMGSVACGLTETESRPPLAAPDLTAEPLMPSISCEIMTPDAINETKNRFENDTNNNDRTKWQIANELGLTIYDYYGEFDDLIANVYGPYHEDIPVAEYISRTSEFLSLYGVDLITKDNASIGILNDKLYTMSEITEEDSRNIKLQLIGIADSLGEMPVELVRYIGLNQIVLIHADEVVEGRSAAGYVDPNMRGMDTIYIDPSSPKYMLLEHEMLHLWDIRECGAIGMYDDKQYVDLNPINIYKDRQDYVHADEIIGRKGKVAVREEYGFFNVVEDKATLGEVLLNPLRISDAIDADESPILKNKALLLATRLFKNNPDILSYYAQVSS